MLQDLIRKINNDTIPVIFVSLEDFMIPCLNKKLFGFDCPGCGIQRAYSILFQGDFIAAFKMYPAIYTYYSLVVSF